MIDLWTRGWRSSNWPALLFSLEFDSLVWTLSSKGMFSLQPVYKFITFRGVLPIFIHAMWKLKVPPRIYFFLWLLSKELKCLARKNLDDTNCVFCTKKESVEHIFFECVVAKQLWQEIFDTIGFNCCQNFEYIGISMWLCNKRFLIVNILTSAALWGFVENEKPLLFSVYRLEHY